MCLTKLSGLKSHCFFLVNSQYPHIQLATIDDLSRLIHYGDGIFETIRVHNGRAPFFDYHWRRMLISARHYQFIDNSNLLDPYRTILEQLILSLEADYRLKIILSRQSQGYYTPINERCILLAYFEPISAPILLESVHLISELVSDYPMSYANHKTCSALPIIHRAVKNKDEQNSILFINSDKNITECLSENIFALKNDHILTPPLSAGILNGTTRRWVIEFAAKQVGTKVSEDHISLADIHEGDAIFLSSAIQGVRIASSMDQCRLNPIHPIAKRIQSLWLAQFSL